MKNRLAILIISVGLILIYSTPHKMGSGNRNILLTRVAIS
jgi:hypothetical protein